MSCISEYYLNKDLGKLYKLTLVIPTYNRNYYLSRCLWYHAHFPFGQIIVADSSLEEKKIVNRKTVARVREMFGANIIYIEYEPETEKYGGDIYKKWGDAVQHVQTEYSTITTDKQFLIPLTVNSELAFLEENPDYASAESMRYWIEKEKEEYKYLIGRDFHETPSITDDSAVKRYISAIQHDSDGLFMIYRSRIHKKIYNILSKSDVNDIRFGERCIREFGYIFGKSYFQNEKISLCRDVIHTNRSGKINLKESSSQRYPTTDDYIHLGIYDTYYKYYQNCLLQTLGANSTLDDAELINKIQKLDHGMKEKKLSAYTILTQTTTLYKLWQLTPRCIKKPIRNLTGYDDSNYYIKTIPEDVKLIEKLMLKFDYKYKNDESILSD